MSEQRKHIVSHPPFIRVGNTLFPRHCTIVVAALFALVPGVVRFGTAALGVACLSVATAVFWEFALSKLSKAELAVGDGNSVVIGLLFSMMLPATTPWWAVVTGTFIAVIIGKMIFGGTGGNPFNPAVVSVGVLMISWPHLLNFTATLVNYDSAYNMIEPLWNVKYFGAGMAGSYAPMDLLLGKQAGGIGAVTGAGLIAGGLLLIVRGISRWEIALSFLAGVFIAAWGFHAANPEMYAGPVFHLLTGYTLLGAFFLAPEDSSSPVNPVPMAMYGLGGGILTVLIRNKGLYVDGVVYAVLLMNLASPILDKIRPRIIGQGV
jgi:Na+-translocating ferredoxin:NAD+ oxidoreductase subunit D